MALKLSKINSDESGIKAAESFSSKKFIIVERRLFLFKIDYQSKQRIVQYDYYVHK